MSTDVFEYEDPACHEFISLIDKASIKIIIDNGFRCMIGMMAQVLEVAMYVDPKGRWYIRVLDLVDCGSGSEEEISKKWKKYYTLQNNFVGMWEVGDGRNSSIGQRLLTSYRQLVCDPEAPMCQLNNRRGHGNARTSTWFLPIEILPYILMRFEFYTQPSRPEYEPIWEVIRCFQPLPGCPFDMIKPTNSATVRRSRIMSIRPTRQEGTPEPAPGERTVEEELAEDDERLGNRDKRALVSRIRYLGKALQTRDQKNKKENEDLVRRNTALALEVQRLKHNAQRQTDYHEAYIELKGRFDAEQIKWSLATGEEPNETESRAASYGPEVFFSKSQEWQWGQVNRAFKLSKQANDKLQQTGKELDRIRAERDSVRQKYEELAGGASKETYQRVIDELTQSQARIQELTEQLAKTAVPLAMEVERQISRMPATRGRICEDNIYELIRDNLGDGCTILMTRSEARHADFMLIYRKSSRITGYALIDAKHYEDNVGSSQIVKLQNDIDNCTSIYGAPPIWAAIISLTSSISHVGISRAPDFLYGNVKIHLVHSLQDIDDGTSKIISLLETGNLDVESAYCPSIHRTLSDELITRRDTELSKIETKFTEKDCSSRPGRSASVASSQNRSRSSRSRQRRMASQVIPPNVRFQELEQPDTTIDPVLDAVTISEESQDVVREGPQRPTHISQIIKQGPVKPQQTVARQHILDHYEFHSDGVILRSEIKDFLMRTMNIGQSSATKIMTALFPVETGSRLQIYGLRVKK